jgi:hypothetical protein
MSEGIKSDASNVTEMKQKAPTTPMEIASAIVDHWLSKETTEDDEEKHYQDLCKMIAMSLVGAYDSGVTDGNNRLEQRLASMNFTARSELVRILQDKWKQKDKSLYLTT